MKKKKIKKIILAIIVAIISLISVFSCFKGKYTPEPILTPVSVLKPANSVNDNIISPTGAYDKFYFNTSLSYNNVLNILKSINYNINQENIGVYSIFFTDNDILFKVSLMDASQAFSATDAFLIQLDYGDNQYPLWVSESLSAAFGVSSGWNIPNNSISNPLVIETLTGESIDSEGFNVGQQNNLLTNLISPVPFLFEGISNNISWTSTGLDNPNNIQNIYFNTNLSNTAIKNILDTYVGTTAGIDIFNYINGGVLVRCHIINNSANAFIQIIGGSTTLYKWIYDSIDTEESTWWYGIDPSIVDNGNVITSPQGNSLNGFNIYELRSLFSSSNDFVEQTSGDSYEQGYQDGYQAGYSAGETAGYNSGYNTGYDNGYSSGVNNVTTNPNEYNLFTYQEWLAQYDRGLAEGNSQGYEQGYLDGLDDGASSNINYQYVESILNLIGNFLNIEVLPGIKLSYALGIVIILTIISIIKMVVK